MFFDDNQLRKTVYTAEECTAPSKTVQNLWKWAHNLDILGIIGAILILAVGLFSAIGSGKAAAEGIRYKDFVFSVFFHEFILTLLYAFLEYCAFHALALIISSLGSITYNTDVTAKTAISSHITPKDDKNPGTASGQSRPWSPKDRPQWMASGAAVKTPGSWTCPACGKQNHGSAGECSCGKMKPLE